MNMDLLKAARDASRVVARQRENDINMLLLNIADAIEKNISCLLAANERDLQAMVPANPMYDRLKLSEQRLCDIAKDMRHVAQLPSPLGRVLDHRVLDNGLDLTREAVPFGVIGVIYEARPNVTFDVSALCLKAGSACVLKGGSDARYSNEAIVKVIHEALVEAGIPEAAVTLLPADRKATADLLNAHGLVDVIIPRGSSRLINYVREEAKVPVIETGAGVVHAYFDKDGNVQKGCDIIRNAKTRRVSVCNALDCLLVHSLCLPVLGELCRPLAEKDVVIYADERASEALCMHYPAELLKPATDDSYGTEFLDYKMAIRVVDSIDEAIEHIRCNGSGHSECIISEDAQAIELFLNEVDAACVYANAPTSFTDGAQFGLGAEIGISTQKLHARGPMALQEICTYKWKIRGNGQVRS